MRGECTREPDNKQCLCFLDRTVSSGWLYESRDQCGCLQSRTTSIIEDAFASVNLDGKELLQHQRSTEHHTHILSTAATLRNPPTPMATMNRTTLEAITVMNASNITNITLVPTEPEYVITAIGIGYTLTAIIVIPLHIICSCLMWKDKEMRNPTYQFIINLSIADVLELVPLGLYAGIVILLRVQPDDINHLLHRFMAFWVLIAWYANCVLFAFIAFSRWISMTRNYLVQTIFTRRNLYLMHLVPWAILFVFYFCSLFATPLQNFAFYPQFFSWGFVLSLPYGEYLHWHNFVFNTLCAIVEMVFNILSLRWVHQTRKTIQNLATTENQRREVKLLIQCFIIGCVFTLASVMFTIVFAAGLNSPMAFLCVQIVWTFNHCVNPIVYLTVNRRLRRAFIRMITCGKFGHYTNKAKIHASPVVAAVPSSEQPIASGSTYETGDGQSRRVSMRRNANEAWNNIEKV